MGNSIRQILNRNIPDLSPDKCEELSHLIVSEVHVYLRDAVASLMEGMR